MDEFLHLLLPPIVKLLDNPEVPLSVKRIALETIEQLSCTLNFSDFASRYMQQLKVKKKILSCGKFVATEDESLKQTKMSLLLLL